MTKIVLQNLKFGQFEQEYTKYKAFSSELDVHLKQLKSN